MPIVSKIVRVLSKKRHSVSTRTPSLSHKIASTIAEPDHLISTSISLARPAPEIQRIAAVTEKVCAGTLYRDVGTLGTCEFVLRAELHESAETDFVHSIAGRIIADPEGRGTEGAGHIGASLIQFGEALNQGISAERLGDGISGEISEYWEHLFDVETGYPKEEIQNEFEVVDLDLLNIDRVAIYPKFRGLGIAESAIHRTVDIFGTSCGLVACKPWPLLFTPSVADDPEALRKLASPNVGKAEALRKLRSYWSRLGFWPLGNTGLYLLSSSQRQCDSSSQARGKRLQ